ncbi:MAG: hypothetical protein ACTH8F_09735 [Microbacterium sp.]|uniref:hypothetical protein n=1 Tax=Microbacterium sp. TaxID=51671 RepID=UPI003F9A40B8
MTSPRLPRGTRVDPVRVGWLIEGDRKRTLDRVAANVGVSSSVFLERLIEHLEDELNQYGRPTWWPDDDRRDGELPIDAA